jgi:putative DNA primase/helicase
VNIPERQTELDALYQKYFADEPYDKSNDNGSYWGSGGGRSGTSKLTDNALLQKLFDERKKGRQWSAIYNGDFQDYYPSPSEAVMGLLEKIAFYSNNDPIQMERLIRGSGLTSKKFDSLRRGTPWIQGEIAKAIDRTLDTYQADDGARLLVDDDSSDRSDSFF